MERIKEWFRLNRDREVTSITIEKTLPKPCGYCGYGDLIIGHARIKALSDHNEGESECSVSGEEESIDFIFDTGCMTYDEEMDYR